MDGSTEDPPRRPSGPTPPMDALLASLNAINPATLPGDADARAQLITAAQDMLTRLETPSELIARVWIRQPGFLGCLKTADDIQLFHHLGASGGSSPPRDLAWLAQATEVAPALLHRILRQLVAEGVIATTMPATAPVTYRATPLSEALSTPEGSSGIRAGFKLFLPVFTHMPDFLRERAYQSPTDGRDTVFQSQQPLAAGKALFEYFQTPEGEGLGREFDLLMQFATKGRRRFLDVCDVRALLRQRPVVETATAPPAATATAAGNGDAGRTLFVDIGGGTGSDALAARLHLSDQPGQVVLQDQERPIAAARTAGVEAQGVHTQITNFFEPQPVRGARFYYMSSILHDWPDDAARQILTQTVAAMERGYSTLLVSEMVLADAGGQPHHAVVDLVMMTTLASKERSEADWRVLLESVGLRIIRIHHIPSGVRSVIECELA